MTIEYYVSPRHVRVKRLSPTDWQFRFGTLWVPLASDRVQQLEEARATGALRPLRVVPCRRAKAPSFRARTATLLRQAFGTLRLQ